MPTAADLSMAKLEARRQFVPAWRVSCTPKRSMQFIFLQPSCCATVWYYIHRNLIILRSSKLQSSQALLFAFVDKINRWWRRRCGSIDRPKRSDTMCTGIPVRRTHFPELVSWTLWHASGTRAKAKSSGLLPFLSVECSNRMYPFGMMGIVQ